MSLDAPRLRLAPVDLLLALAISVVGFFAVTAPGGAKPAGDTVAGLAMVTVAVAALARRPAPVAGLAILLLADLANIAIFGEHTRCGAIIPLAAILGFVASRRAADGGALVVPGALLAAIGGATAGFELGASAIPAAALVFGGALLAGQVVRRRDIVAEDLDRQTRSLQAQRDQTARLAVESERARIGGDLSAAVEEQVAGVLAAAQAGESVATFAAIEQRSRAGLAHMRAVLDGLAPADAAPQPTLAELDAIVAAERERSTLRIAGERHVLAPGVELAACRIVEMLLAALDPGDAGVHVEVLYSADALEVALRSPRRDPPPDAGVVAAARARAAVVGGSLDVRVQRAQTRARVLLPTGAGA